MPSTPRPNKPSRPLRPQALDSAKAAELSALDAPSSPVAAASTQAPLARPQGLDASTLAALGLSAASQVGEAIKIAGGMASAWVASRKDGASFGAALRDAIPNFSAREASQATGQNSAQSAAVGAEGPVGSAGSSRQNPQAFGLEGGLPQGGFGAFWATTMFTRVRGPKHPDGLGACGAINRHAPSLRVGVAGFSAQAFDAPEAERILRAVFSGLAAQWAPRAPASITLVGGLTDEGVCAIAYRLAVEMGWATRGVVSLQALSREWFPVDQALLTGSNWGDESRVFVQEIDAFVRVGGGSIARQEEALSRARGLPVLAFELKPVGGSANAP